MTRIRAQRGIAVIAAVVALASGTVHAQRSNENQRSGTEPPAETRSEQSEKASQSKTPERKEIPLPRRESKQADCKGSAQLCKQDSAR